MLKKAISVSIFLLILLSLLNCSKKKKYEDKPSQNLGFFGLGEAKDYLLFKQGSWWVYKNSLTNEIDTMILTASEFHTILVDGSRYGDSKSLIYEFESITTNIISKRDNASYHTFCRNMGGDDMDFYEIWEFQCERDSGFYSKYFSGYGLSTTFFYPFYSNEHNGLGGAKIISMQDTMTVKGKLYNSVVSFSVIQDGAYPYPNIYIFQNGNSIYHWAKNVGIIKIEHESYDKNFQPIKMSWELVDAHIVQ